MPSSASSTDSLNRSSTSSASHSTGAFVPVLTRPLFGPHNARYRPPPPPRGFLYDDEPLIHQHHLFYEPRIHRDTVLPVHPRIYPDPDGYFLFPDQPFEPHDRWIARLVTPRVAPREFLPELLKGWQRANYYDRIRVWIQETPFFVPGDDIIEAIPCRVISPQLPKPEPEPEPVAESVAESFAESVAESLEPFPEPHPEPYLEAYHEALRERFPHHFLDPVPESDIEPFPESDLEPFPEFDMEDDFAQSRGADDLFSDEIEAPGPEAQYYPDGLSPAAPPGQPAEPAPVALSRANVKAHTRQHDDPKQQWLAAHKQQQLAEQQQPDAGYRSRGANSRGDTSATQSGPPRLEHSPPASGPPPAALSPPADSPQATPPGQPAAARITSVRGDRSATGPAKPQKRTEAELTALMASMQLKNAAKSEAHARAEKDQAAYLQREAVAAAKRVEERRSVREMDMERAKNRERKIKAQGGREWDSDKTEADIVDGKARAQGSMYRRGAHGGVAGQGGIGLGIMAEGSGHGYQDDRRGLGGFGEQGRGDENFDFSHRSDRGGRGGGRGGRPSRGRGGGLTDARKGKGPAASGEEDFPALPAAAKPEPAPQPETASPETAATDAAAAADAFFDAHHQKRLGGLAQSNWADEVEERETGA